MRPRRWSVPEFYRQFVWPFEKRLVEQLHAMGTRVRLHICGNTTAILEPMGQLGCDIVDLDFMVPMDKARHLMGPQQVLLGNIDPVRVLRGETPETVRAAIALCHRQTRPRYIVGAGCEVPRNARGQPPCTDRICPIDTTVARSVARRAPAGFFLSMAK